MLISRASIESVKERASLVDVAGELIKLKRQGSSVVGLCPFHSERSPSFHIRDNGKYFHCFGCGAAGNVISFVMQIRGLSFPDAVAELAQRYGIVLQLEKGGVAQTRPENSVSTDEREQLYKLNAFAQAWFSEKGKQSGSPMPAYLVDRGIGAAAMTEFGIGYAPPEFSGLGQAALAHKIPSELLFRGGLVRRSERGDTYDTFRSRVMFPILDERKRIIGFGGRLIGASTDSRAPKYINSPETPLYEKSKVLYGLPHSMPQLRATKEAIIVEGYFDVIGLWQAGIRRALAPCGTALTEAHVRRLMHLVNRVVLLFDGDTAGSNAAGKIFPLFVNSGLDVQVVGLPSGEDPDTFALKYGENTEAALAKLRHRPLLDCYIDFLAAGASVPIPESPSVAADAGVSTIAPHALPPAAKGKVAAQLGSVIGGVLNAVERAELLERCSNILKVPIDALAKMSQSQGAANANINRVPSGESIQSGDDRNSVDAEGEIPPGIERSLLTSVMALKGDLPGLILADGELCELLTPITIEFIHGFNSILTDSSLDEIRQKEATRSMLKGYGKSWLALWREAHTAVRDDSVNLQEVLGHARVMAKKQRIQALINELERGIATSHDDNEKLALTQAKIDLVRRTQVKI